MYNKVVIAAGMTTICNEFTAMYNQTSFIVHRDINTRKIQQVRAIPKVVRAL